MSILERPSANARDRFLQIAARQTTSRPHAWVRRVFLASFGTTAWLVTMLLVLGIRRDWNDLPMPGLATTIGGLLAAAVLASLIGLGRGRSMVGSTTEALSIVAWATPLLLLLLVTAVDPLGPSTVATKATPVGYLLHAWPCALLVFLIALPFMGIGLFVRRELVLSRPGLAGACLGLAASTWAHLLIRVHCPLGGVEHAVLGHLLPLLPLMVLGAWAMRRR
ncbi:MAG: NrsF family protein [Polyangia bacterium]|jgi:hypothetical protein